MTTTLFIVLVGFTDFDSCWNFWHEQKPALSEAIILDLCTEIETDPIATVRPKARPTKDQ